MKENGYNCTSITKEKIKEFFEEIYNKPEPPRKYVIYTGYVGMWAFEFAMLGIKGGMFSGIKIDIQTGKRTNDTWFSIGPKHGNIKVKIDRKGYVSGKPLMVYNATKYIFSTDSTEEIVKYYRKDEKENTTNR